VEKDSSALCSRRKGGALTLAKCHLQYPGDLARTSKLRWYLLAMGLPENDFDDLAGSTSRASGSPVSPVSSANSSPGVAHQTAAERWKAFRAAGASGPFPSESSFHGCAWARISLNRLHPGMELAGAKLRNRRENSCFNPAHADKLFGGSGQLPGTAELAKDPTTAALPLSVSIRPKRSSKRNGHLFDIVASLQGSDAIKSELCGSVCTIDHVGIGEPVNGTALQRRHGQRSRSGVPSMWLPR